MNVEDIPLRVKHLIRYMDSMVPKDKKTMADKYPVEMTKTDELIAIVAIVSNCIRHW
tara:strand:- start:1084 stop:1254 length:171 start_codon:yes stop_codon:yes gene_type:complete